MTLDAGSYSVDEAAVSGYTEDDSGRLLGPIANGETKTCTITNDDQPGTLMVIKHVINDNGGTQGCQRLLVDGERHECPTDRHIPRRGVTGNDGDTQCRHLQRGRSGRQRLHARRSADCSGAIANGETKTCTVTNDDQPGTLIVIKHVINNDGGTKVAADFSLSVTGTNVLPHATFNGAEAPGTTVDTERRQLQRG